MPLKNYNHLTVYLEIPDQAFEDYWQSLLAILTGEGGHDLHNGAKMKLNKEQLEALHKLAFMAGREAAMQELETPKFTGKN